MWGYPQAFRGQAIERRIRLALDHVISSHHDVKAIVYLKLLQRPQRSLSASGSGQTHAHFSLLQNSDELDGPLNRLQILRSLSKKLIFFLSVFVNLRI